MDRAAKIKVADVGDHEIADVTGISVEQVDNTKGNISKADTQKHETKNVTKDGDRKPKTSYNTKGGQRRQLHQGKRYRGHLYVLWAVLQRRHPTQYAVDALSVVLIESGPVQGEYTHLVSPNARTCSNSQNLVHSDTLVVAGRCRAPRQ